MLFELLGLGVTAAITENLVFCRGLEYGLQNQDKERVPDLLRLGGTTTLLTAIAACCGWLGRYMVGNWLVLLNWTRPALYIAVYGVAIVLLMVGMNLCKTLLGHNAGKMATRLVYGFVPLGTLLVIGNGTLGFGQSLLYGVGAGAGFLMAALLNHGLQVRLEHSDMPMVFRGMPSALLTLGLLSLAVFGLLGHPLAA